MPALTVRSHPLLKYLPLYLTLLAPLAALAWFGGANLQRLEERARAQLRNEAVGFVEERMRKVEQDIQRQAQRWLHESLGDGLIQEKTLVAVLRGLAREPQVLEVFVCDGAFRLLAPHPSLSKAPSLPLHEFPADADNEQHHLAQADLLCSLEDYEGSVQAYKDYLTDRGRRRDYGRLDFGRIWAYFHLGGLQDRLGKQVEAIDNYFYASTIAEDLYFRNPGEDLAAVMLLSELRRAQLSYNPEGLLQLLQRVCEGEPEFLKHLADDLISWTIDDICRSVPHSEENLQIIERARDSNRLRVASRSFAHAYGNLAQRELRNAVSSGFKKPQRGILYHVLTTESDTSLLALRRASVSEGQRFKDAAWVGLRLDLPGLVVSSLSGNTRSQAGNVELLVRDPSDVPLLESAASLALPSNPELQFAPQTSFLDLEFQAIAITDAEAIRSGERNKALMVLILVLTAASGAFLLIRAMRREAELAQMKVQLVSRVTHELKTPLAVIKMYGETLGMGRTRDQSQVGQFAGIISHEADRLTNMVDRILDFSKMEQGTFQYQQRRIDLSALVAQVCSEYEAHVESQGAELDWQVEPGIEAHADAEAYSGALINLLENAVKYSADQEGPHPVEVVLRRHGELASLVVRDRGQGIPEADLGRVFDEFYRASNAGEVRGAGIGLSLVRHFAQAHEGRIIAKRREGGGTSMTLTLPLHSETGTESRPSHRNATDS